MLRKERLTTKPGVNIPTFQSVCLGHGDGALEQPQGGFGESLRSLGAATRGPGGKKSLCHTEPVLIRAKFG